MATWPASGISSKFACGTRTASERERTVDPVALAAEDEQRRFQRRDLPADVEALLPASAARASRPASDRAYCSARSAREARAHGEPADARRLFEGETERDERPHDRPQRSKRAALTAWSSSTARPRSSGTRGVNTRRVATRTHRPAAPTPQARCRCRAVAVQQDEVAHTLVTVTDPLA